MDVGQSLLLTEQYASLMHLNANFFAHQSYFEPPYRQRNGYTLLLALPGPCSRWRRVYETLLRPSVRPSICLLCPSVLSGPRKRVCCCGSGGQEISIDCCTAGVRRANAGSAALSAYVVAEHRLVL